MKIMTTNAKDISLLNKTLSTVKAESDERPGWQAIISLYETAIEKAKRGEPFSVRDAARIYLEFNSDYTTEIFKLLDKTAVELE